MLCILSDLTVPGFAEHDISRLLWLKQGDSSDHILNFLIETYVSTEN